MGKAIAAVLGAVCGLVLAAPAMAQESLEQIVEASNPAAVAMHKYFPDDFAAMITALKMLPASPDAATVRATALPYVTRIVAAHSSQIDEAEGTATLTLTMDEMRAVREKSPAACVALVTGQAAAVDQTLIPVALQARYALNTAAAFEQIGAHPAPPVPPMTTAELGRFARQGYDQLPVETQTTVGPLMAGQPPQTHAEIHAMCDLYLAMLDSVLHGPPGSVRGFMAMGSAR
jgi:hypothetical protein